MDQKRRELKFRRVETTSLLSLIDKKKAEKETTKIFQERR